MKSIDKIIKIFALVLPLLAMHACTKLEETVYSELITDNYYNSKQEVLSAILRPYTHTNAWITSSGQVGYWRVNELAADQLAWPVKGIHRQDNGNWLRLHYHTWFADDANIVWDPWNLMWTGVGYCNSPIGIMEQKDIQSMGLTQQEKDGFIAELKLLRAFHYIKLMDLFGNIPIVTQVGIPTSPPTRPRAEVFQFVEKEIKENIDKVPDLSSSLLGRMSKAGGYAMLAELYLNAVKWSGTARWDDCIAACDKLIQSTAGSQAGGAMALDPNITDTYKNTNHLSKEIIFS